MISVIGPPMDDHAIEKPIRPAKLVRSTNILPISVFFFFLFLVSVRALYVLCRVLYMQI